MVVFAAVVLFAWGAVTAGYGAYAASAALATQNTFHATQAGIALLIATVSVSAGFLVAGGGPYWPRPSVSAAGRYRPLARRPVASEGGYGC